MSEESTSFDEAIAVDRRFFDALLSGDDNALEGLLDPQFVIVDVAAGDVIPRADFIAAVASRAVTFERIDTSASDSLVRRLGDCVVVVGRTTMRVVMPSGDLVATDSRYTHVFTPGTTGWRLASAQGTPISPAPAPRPVA